MRKKTSMPIEDIATIAGGKLDSAFNIWSQGVLNRAQQKFGLAMYERQRKDNKADWDMQNEYNSPSGQMARLRTAGLNPNLVYGHGADAQMGAPMKQASAPESKMQDAPNVKGGSLLDYYDIKMKEAQINNLESQNTVLTNEALLKEAQTRATNVATGRGQFDLDFETEMRPFSAEMRKGAPIKQSAETSTMLDRNDREAAANASNLREAVERILRSRMERSKIPHEINHIKQQIENLKKDVRLKQLDIELKEKGIQPGDNMFMRVAARIINNPKVVGAAVDKVANKVRSKLLSGWGDPVD